MRHEKFHTSPLCLTIDCDIIELNIAQAQNILRLNSQQNNINLLDKVFSMANVLSLVSYKIFPAKLGGQKGIALFNEYLSAFHQLICVTVIANDPAHASYQMLNILSDSRFRYINFFLFFYNKAGY